MLADAQFLHQKLSVLKNVSAPTNMLETLVAEKSIPRKSTLGSLRAAGPNERLRGLLSRRESTKLDKPLPSPTHSPQASSSNGTIADEVMGDSDRVIPSPRTSSRSSDPMRTGAKAPPPVEGNSTGRDMLQSEEESLEKPNPISSVSSLSGLRDPCGSNGDVQHATLPS